MAGARCDVSREDGRAWDEMWTALQVRAAELFGHCDQADEDPGTGEVWQYMGSTQTEHHFRHRCHPREQARVYLHLDRRTLAVSRVTVERPLGRASTPLASPTQPRPMQLLRPAYHDDLGHSDADPGL